MAGVEGEGDKEAEGAGEQEELGKLRGTVKVLEDRVATLVEA